MEIFNIFCGACSIVGLLVSIFTAGKVIKISQTINSGNMNDRSRVINRGRGNIYNGSYAGRDALNGTGSSEQKQG